MSVRSRSIWKDVAKRPEVVWFYDADNPQDAMNKNKVNEIGGELTWIVYLTGPCQVGFYN